MHEDPYFNTQDQMIALFYPDWIVKFRDGRIGIFDTKKGETAIHPQGREVGLKEKIAAMNEGAKVKRFIGGLVIQENGVWYYHEGEDYSYQPGKLGKGWKLLSSLFG